VDPDELALAGAARQAELVRSGAVEPREVVAACLRRIERLDGELNAFREVFWERALAEAGDVARDGPLAGVPIAMKAETDADGVLAGRVRAAGGVIIGTTQLPELAAWPFTESSAWGITRNPLDPAITPGGSSGGSAAAVAAGMCGAAVGSDGGGSIRIPAACCGIVGLKPTRGAVPGHEAWDGLSVAGPIGRTVLDTALLGDALAGTTAWADAARGAPPAPLRIAWSLRGAPPARVRAYGIEIAVRSTAERLRALGHAVEERDPDYGPLGAAYTPRYLAGVSATARVRPPVEPRTRTLARLGTAVTPWLPAARRLSDHCAARIATLFEAFDVLVLPVIAGPPPRAGRWTGRGALRTLAGVAAAWPPFTFAFNLTGQPAIAIPGPVQLVGRHGDEATLVALAAQL
jgi:amidase